MLTDLSQGFKVVFVQMEEHFNGNIFHPHDIVISFNIAYSATILKKNGYKVEILDNRLERLSQGELVEALVNTKGKIFFIQVNTLQVESAKALAREIKNNSSKNTYVFAVGQQATILPESILMSDHRIDGCILEEPEKVILELVNLIEKGNNRDLLSLEGLAYFDDTTRQVIKNLPQNNINDLDHLPFIDYSLFDIERYKKHSAQIRSYRRLRWGFLLSSRGCPSRCRFCSPFLRHSFGSRFRAQSAKRTIDEIEYLSQEFHVNAFSFEDDNFTLDRQRVLDLCKEIKRRHLRLHWVAQVCLEYLDEELLYKMRECGCDTLRAGVESGSQRILTELNKPLEVEYVKKIVALIKKTDISLTLFFMLNNPSETYSEMEQTFKLACELNPTMLHVYFCTPYPGSELYEKFKEEKKEISFCSHLDRVSYQLSNVGKDITEAFQKKFYKRFFFSRRFLLNYFKNRGRYHLLRMDEWRLVINAFRFLNA